MKYILIAALLISGPVFATNYPEQEPVMVEQKQSSINIAKGGQGGEGGEATGGSVGPIDIDVIDSRVVNHNLGDTTIDLDGPTINQGHNNQSVYMPRSLELMEAGRSSMSAQGNSVTMPTLGVIAQDVKSDGPYGDDRVYGLRLDIPITWGLPKRKDVIGAGISNQNAQTQMIIDDNNRQTKWAIQNMKEQAEDHALNVDLLCHQLHLAGRIRDSFGENHPCHGKDYKTVNHDRDVAEIGADRLPGH